MPMRRALDDTFDAGVEHEDKRQRLAEKINTVLPTEILEHIFNSCGPQSLLRIIRASRRLYTIAVPYLYCTFKPAQWTDILQLKRLLKHALRADDDDQAVMGRSIASKIHTIDLSRLPEKLVGDQEDIQIQLTNEWVNEKTLRCLVLIAEQAKNLESFISCKFLNEAKSNALWDALGEHSLHQLSLPKFQYFDGTCEQLSKFTSMTSLQYLHLQSDNDIFETRMSQSLSRLMTASSSSLQVFTLRFGTDKVCPYRDYDVGIENEFQLASLKKLQNVRHVDLRGIQLRTHTKDIYQAIGPLPRLHSLVLRYPPKWFLRCKMSIIKLKEMDSKLYQAFPALKVVETEDEDFLIRTFHLAKIHSVHIDGSLVRNKELLGALRNCDTLIEVHLKDVGSLSGRYGHKEAVAALLRSLPASVMRLAIRIEQEEDMTIKLTDKVEEMDIIKALGHLVNLECLILPEQCKAFDVAQDIIRSSILPSLRWVYFRRGNDLANLKDTLDRKHSGEDVAPHWWHALEKWKGLDPCSVIMGIKLTRSPVVDGESHDGKESSLIGYSQAMKIKAEIVKLYIPLYYH